MLMRFLLVPTAFFAMLMQSPQGDDPENAPPEPGKPLHCDNYLKTPKDHRCECGRAMQKCGMSKDGLPDSPVDVRMDAKCKTYCRAQHCLCVGDKCSG